MNLDGLLKTGDPGPVTHASDLALAAGTLLMAVGTGAALVPGVPGAFVGFSVAAAAGWLGWSARVRFRARMDWAARCAWAVQTQQGSAGPVSRGNDRHADR